MHTTDEILAYWFGDWDDTIPVPDNCPQMKRWWGHDPAVDAELRERFAADHLHVARDAVDNDVDNGRDALARVILLDQIPRNIYRGTPHMFATDWLAQRVARRAVDRGEDQALSFCERAFLYMPFMHAEDLESHRVATECFGALAAAADAAGVVRADYYNSNLGYEHQHRHIIERFGRYPHRNRVLGRKMTAEEARFLDEGGSSF